MMKSRISVGVVVCFAALLISSVMASAAKKLIEIGWDTPLPSYVEKNVRTMEQKPFDGLVMKLNDNNVFSVTKWSETAIKPEMDALARTQFVKFTDNFLYTNITPIPHTTKFDWYNDTQWNTIAYNTALLAKAAAGGRCKGIVFDPEPYSSFEPWRLSAQPYASSRGYAQYKAKARQRGAQFMRALQQYLPSPRILMLFGTGMLSDLADMSQTDLDRELTNDDSYFSRYALLPAFIDGMLDAASYGAQIIDGNEGSSYYYYSSDQFYYSSNRIRTTCANLVSPVNRTKYQRQVKVAQPLYGDYIFHLFDIPGVPNTGVLSSTEKARFAEHNAYYALKSSNDYAWIYTERVNWWTNQIPSGFQTALSNARTKVNSYQSLGFSTSFLSKVAW